MDVAGSEFRIGVARGRMLGGDWGISYYRKRVRDGSFISDVEQECDVFGPGCFMNGDEQVAVRNGVLNAVEFRKFASFATIRQRVQIGLEFGGGIGQMSGEYEERFYFPDVVDFQANRPVVVQAVEAEPLPPEDFFPLGVMPVGRLELAVAGIVLPGVKVRASGGIGFPANTAFTLTGVYFFGAR